MEQANYIVEQVDATTLESLEILNASDASLIDDFQIDSEFNQNTDIIRLDYLSLAGNILSSNFDYRDYSQLLGSSAAGRDGAVNLTLFPDQDAVRGGYDNGDVILVYNFFQNLLSMNGRRGGELFVRDISPDRFEFRALTTQIEDVDLTSKVTDIAARLADNSYFSEFYLDFKDKGVKIAINIAPDTVEQGAAVVFRMYEPLPANIAANDLFTVETKVSDTVAFRVTREFVEDRTVVIPAAGPNFNPQQIENEKNPTEFQSLSELYNSGLGMGGPGSIINSGSYELEALLREKGANVSIDYSSYSNFVHFSNAEERLRNFRYKLDLIKSYESSLASLETGSMSGPGITGSRDFYSNQIRTVLRGFDGYDRHLYFESGSTSWPKQSGSTEPYINLPSSHTSASKWYTDQIEVAEGYDNTNPDNILNAIPAFLREDTRNEPYLLYANMIGQHFDSIWVYTKAVADKYDTDHRKNYGIASSMLRSAIESLGVKYYDSTFNLSSIYNNFIGSTYNTGSEMINNLVMVTSGSFSPLWSGSAAQYLPVSQNDYIEEVQKRIYHNLPLLTKAKGTYKAMNVLLNSFGIPPSFLPVRSFGGTNTNASQDFGPAEFQTSSLGKIRIDNTGSMATGSTLSRYTSTEIPDGKYSDDSQALEIGIDLSSTMNNFIRDKIPFNFDIDQYIGDPRAQFSDNYFVLNNEALSLTVEGRDYDPNAQNEVLNRDYVTGSVGLNPTTVTRLLNFYDTSVFRMMQDFTPARASANPGLTIRNHILHRPKAKAVSASSFQSQYTGSFEIGSASGVQGGGAFPVYKNETDVYTTSYEFSGSTPIGLAPIVVEDQRPRYNGEFGSFNRETRQYQNSGITVSQTSFQDNNPFLTTLQPDLSYDLSAVTLTSLAASECNLAFFFTNLGDLFEFHIVDHTAATRATAQITYPTASSFTNMETVEIDWDDYEFVSVTAGAAAYPFGAFDGWYTTASGSGTLVTSSATLTVFDGYEERYGTHKFYARYQSTHSNPFD